MVLLALALAASADVGGFEPVREAAGCEISMRPESSVEGAAMRAECRWPEVDPARLVAMLSAYDRYSDFVYPISEARVVRVAPDGRALVWQRQSMFGIADREVLLWMWREDRPDGSVRFSWTTASEEPLRMRPGSVRTPRNEGYWQVGRDPSGGATVVHEVALDAGGSVPRWLVALVRTRGFAKIMEDVRAAADAPGGA
jgi:hypothetical protein